MNSELSKNRKDNKLTKGLQVQCMSTGEDKTNKLLSVYTYMYISFPPCSGFKQFSQVVTPASGGNN